DPRKGGAQEREPARQAAGRALGLDQPDRRAGESPERELRMDLGHAVRQRGVRGERLVDLAQPRKEEEALDRDAEPRRAARAIGGQSGAIGRPRQRAARGRAEDGARAAPSEKPARGAVALAAARRGRVEQADRNVDADVAGAATATEVVCAYAS